MVNAAQYRCHDFGMLMLFTQEKTMSDDLKPDDFSIPAAIESGELNRLANETGIASWKDGASSRPKPRYSYDVEEM
jgi:hypothetical protein